MDSDASSVFSESYLELFEESDMIVSELQPRRRPEEGLLKDDDSADKLPKRRQYDSYVYQKNLLPFQASSKAKTSTNFTKAEWSKIVKEEPLLYTPDGSAPFIVPDEEIKNYAMNEHSSSDEGDGKKHKRLMIRKRKNVVAKKTGKYENLKRRKRREKIVQGEVNEAKNKRDSNGPPPPPDAGASSSAIAAQ